MDKKIPLRIDDHLQRNITFLCREIDTREWSGMLFYDTSGEFGEDNFEICAKELFLLDIGTSTRTEYDLSDAELVKFMMERENVRTMKKGHIHSHNSMGVFFSGTDTEELCDNCGLHNFYLSLIVNNKNEMCAKVAFKADTKSVISTTMRFRDEKGKVKEKSASNEKDEACIYIYDCKIERAQEVESSFRERFQEVLKKSTSTYSGYHSNTYHKEYSSGVGKQVELWPGAGNKFNDTAGFSKDYLNSSARSNFRETPKIVSSPIGKLGDNSRIVSMLSKLLSLDFICEKSLRTVLSTLQNSYYEVNEGVGEINTYELYPYLQMVEERACEFYIDSFPEDPKLKFFDAVIEKCTEILEGFSDTYPDLTIVLIESLNYISYGNNPV